MSKRSNPYRSDEWCPMTRELLKELWLRAPDPCGFDKTCPGYREAWFAVAKHFRDEEELRELSEDEAARRKQQP